MTEVVFVRGEDVLSIMKYLKKTHKEPDGIQPSILKVNRRL